MAEKRFNFARVKENLTNAKEQIPQILANDAKNYFVASFDKQSWNGQQWQEVKRRIPGTPEYKYPTKKDLGRRTRPILIGKGSGKLRRFVSNSIRTTQWPIVRLVVDLPYARAHNEGNTARNLPKRQYVGQTDELTKIQKNHMTRIIDKIWK